MAVAKNTGPELPTVGRLVHVGEAPGCLPALVVATANAGQIATLVVINTDGTTTVRKNQDASGWHWPERA